MSGTTEQSGPASSIGLEYIRTGGVTPTGHHSTQETYAMKKICSLITVLFVIVITYGGMAHTASAAIFHAGNAEVVFLTERGDTIANIARSVVKEYDLANNVGACTKAMVRDYYKVSWKTYLKNPAKYDRTFRAGKVYELSAACMTKFVNKDEVTSASTPPVAIADTEPVTTTNTELFPPYDPARYAYVTPDDQHFRNGEGQTLECLRKPMGSMKYYMVADASQKLYRDARNFMEEFFKHGCEEEYPVMQLSRDDP